MLKKWTIGNFKSLAKRVNLPLAPLTLVCGPNSSGKSTLIQSMLMVAQTFASQAEQRALVFNAELVKLGYLSDIVHGGEMRNSMDLGFRLEKKNRPSHIHLQEIDVEATFYYTSADIESSTTKVNVKTVSLCTNGIKICANAQTENNRLVNNPAFKYWQIPDGLREQIRAGQFDFDLEDNSDTRLVNQRKLQYCSLMHFLPCEKLVKLDMATKNFHNALEVCSEALSADYSLKTYSLINDIEFKTEMGNSIQKELGKILYKLRRDRQYRGPLIQNFASIENLLSQSSNLMEWIEQVRRQYTKRVRNAIARELFYRARMKVDDPSKETDLRTEPFQPEVVQAMNEIVDFFTKRMRYLGPLRDDPRMVYGIPLIPDSEEVGMKGEFTAAVLERFGKYHRIKCPVPPDGDYLPLRTKTMPLIDAVILWLRHMGLIDDVTTQDRGKMGVELTLSVEGLEKQLDLTNVGVGVSQILPILTMCLLAPDDGLILLEQPELHLHPRVQMMLSDFLLGIAARGTQCIVETHSDRVINRIRRRIAEDDSNKVMQLSRIYFFERIGNETRILPIEPNEYGAITRWPKGFFDEGPDESQRIAQAANRKREARLQKPK